MVDQQIDRRVYSVENELVIIKKLVYDNMEKNDKDMSELMNKIDVIMDYHKRQQGFIAGIVFAISTIAAGVVFFIQNIFHK
jgi:hypothetical protein